jgi:hypothetical protein
MAGGRDASQSDFGGSSSGGNNNSDGGDAREQYGAVGQYSSPSPSPTSSGDGGDRPTMADIAGAITSTPDMSHFGDTGDIIQADFTPYNVRPDTITSFFDNYAANVKSNPLNLGVIGGLKTLYQTQQAKDLLGFGSSGFQGGDGDGGDGGDGEQAFINNAISQLPYAMTGTTPQDSMVNQYFSNLGTSGSGLSSDLQTSYNNAKNNISSILGTNQQFGYSTAPYGLLSSINMADNPFNIPYLQQRGLI